MSNLFRVFSARRLFFPDGRKTDEKRAPTIDKTRREKYNRTIKREGVPPGRADGSGV